MTPLILVLAALLSVAPFVPASAFFLATRNPALMPASIPAADEQPIVSALSAAAGLDESAAIPRKISEDALNSFLARHMRMTREADGNGVARQSMIVRLQPGRLVVFEMIRDMGLDWVARIDVSLPASGKPVLEGARIGALDCPPAVAVELWKNLEPQFADMLAASRIFERFSVKVAAAGVIEIQPRTSPATSMNP